MLEKIFKSRKKKVNLLKTFDLCSIKNKKKVLIVVKHSVSFSGNLRIALEEISKSRDDLRIYLYKDGIIHKESKAYLHKNKITILEGFNLISLFHIVTSGVVIVGHTIRDAYISQTCTKRLIINLWHGVIFKNIELLMKNITESKKSIIYDNSKLYNLITASSDIDKKSMTKAFGVNSDNVVITGLLRYELLKESYSPNDKSLVDEIRYIDKIKSNYRLVLYAPTFRETDYNVLNNLNLHQISDFAQKNNFIFCIRLHPYMKNISQKKIKNIFFLNNDKCKETNILLKYTDLLIVDYSSIWIDFLLLKKPIIMYTPDIDNYSTKERDFAYIFDEVINFKSYIEFNKVLQDIPPLLTKKTVNYNLSKSIFHKYDLNTNYKAKFIKTFNHQYKELFHE